MGRLLAVALSTCAQWRSCAFAASILATWLPGWAEAAVNCSAPGIACRSGVIAANEVWTASSVYVLTGDVTVSATATLTIQPGVVVKFLISGAARYRLRIAGGLQVLGTTPSKVYFTSSRDDTIGGDTDNDTSTASAGDWGMIEFQPDSTGLIQNAEVRYGGYFSLSGGIGVIYLSGSSPTLSGVTVKSCYRSAVSALASDSPAITGFSATGCPIGGLEIRSGTLSSHATWSNMGIVYVPSGNLTVAPGASLTIAPGIVMKPVYDFSRLSLVVAGHLQVNGTPGGKVFVTSIFDDTVGGDTNGDGANTRPAAGEWGRIEFQPDSTGSIQNAELRYGGYFGGGSGVVHINDSSPGTPALSGVTMKSCYRSAISALATDSPLITGFSATGCPIGGLEIRSGALNANAIWSNTGIVYVPTGDLTVPPGTSLTVSPGVVIKPNYDSNRFDLVVAGQLQVNGTLGTKVYVTSIFDDTIGGDTNGDGGGSSPATGQWGRIEFQPGSTGSIQNGELRYGGYSGGSTGVVYLNGSSPTLSGVTVKNGWWSAISALATDSPAITSFSATGTPIGGLEIRSGALNANATWSNTGIVYVPTGDLTVSPAASLTIGPAVVVKFPRDFSDYSLVVAGQLAVNAAAGAKTYFTSLGDDTIGGDTNGDASASAPATGDWGGLEFPAGGAGVLSYAEIRYANNGLYASGGNLGFANGDLRFNTNGVYDNGLATLYVNRSNLTGNTTYAAFAAPSSGGVDARWNWWGSTAGPSSSGANRVSSGVIYDPWIGGAILESRPTVTTLSSSANPSAVGAELTLTTTVTGAGGTPTGVVRFFDGASLLGTTTLASGTATLTSSSLTQGTHSIKTEYVGDALYDRSASSVLSQVIGPPRPVVSIADASTAEGHAGPQSLVFALTLSQASGQTVSVSWATADGTAQAGNDYVAGSGIVTFTPGATSRTVSVSITGDRVLESDETLQVTLSNPVEATLGDSTAEGRILNDDRAAKDLDGDGHSDIVWRHTGGALYVWQMNGMNLASSSYLLPISLAWTIQGMGDFNGDGQSDLLWREASSGATYLWFMDGATTIGAGYTASQTDNSWTIQGVGDFDADGKADILWRHTGGALYVWQMDGTATKTASYLPPISLAWQVKQLGDFDGDGMTDVLWRESSSGSTYLWLMDGAVAVGAGYTASQADNTWVIQAP